MAAVQSVYETMKALRDKTSPLEIKNVATSALLKAITRAASYDEATRKYLSTRRLQLVEMFFARSGSYSTLNEDRAIATALPAVSRGAFAQGYPTRRWRSRPPARKADVGISTGPQIDGR